MNKRNLKILLVSIVLMLILGPMLVKAGHYFPYTRIAVADGWTYGSNEYWHLQPVNERSTFRADEKVQFFAQVGPINTWHQWKLSLYRDNNLYREITNEPFIPDPNFGWNYSNFVPYLSNLQAGSYRADYLLNTGSGFERIASATFQVTLPQLTYLFHHAVTATNWQHGSGSEYWNLQPINQKIEFESGEKIYLMVQTRNVYVDHSYKVELFKDNTKLWEYSTPTLNVNEGWAFSNFYPYYENARPGSYTYKTYINTGNGWQLLATVPFTVKGIPVPYVYDHTYIAPGWQYGSGNDYWNLQPVDAKTTFTPGSKVYALAQVRNIYINHQWKAELYRNGNLSWTNTSDWLDVGNGWTFGNYYPYYENAQPGNYEFKIYLNTGSGFILLDKKPFTVTGQSDDYTYASATIARGWTYGTTDLWDIQPVDPRTTFNEGDDVYLVAQAKNVYVNHRWKVETYRNNTLLWSNSSNWNNVGSGWSYSNYYPAQHSAASGNYEFKLYIDTGIGFKLLDTKQFTVNVL
jgi:hypothetical protein